MTPTEELTPRVAFDDFLKLDIRVGTIVAAEEFPRRGSRRSSSSSISARMIGAKKSSAQITRHYRPAALVGRQVAAVVNFAPRQIGPFLSEVLTLGFPDATARWSSIAPSRPVPNGGRLF